MSNDPAALPGAIAAFNSAVDQWFNQRSIIAVREATDAQIYGLDARTGVYHHPPVNYGEELLAMHGALADRRNAIIRTGNELVPLLALRGEDALAVAVQAVAVAASDGNPSHIEQTRVDVKARLRVLAAKLGAAHALRPAERDWFGDAIKLFDSPPEDDRTQAIVAAAGIWIGYALFGEAIECLTNTTADEKYKLRSDLDYAHYEATEFLMMEAERVGLKGARLSEERRVCQELFKPVRGQGPVTSPYPVSWFHHPKPTSDHWPDCLGEWRYALLPAMQKAIRRGEEVFTRLMVRLSITPAVDPQIREAVKRDDGKLPEANERADDLRQDADRPHYREANATSEAGSGEVVEVTQQGSKGPQPDGPFDADGFRFAGVEVRFGRAAKQYRLVLALWDVAKSRPAEPRPIQDVIDEVWGEGNDTDDARFRSLCSEVRQTRFQPANCPLDIRPMQGKVQLVPV